MDVGYAVGGGLGGKGKRTMVGLSSWGVVGEAEEEKEGDDGWPAHGIGGRNLWCGG